MPNIADDVNDKNPSTKVIISDKSKSDSGKRYFFISDPHISPMPICYRGTYEGAGLLFRNMKHACYVLSSHCKHVLCNILNKTGGTK